MKKILLTTLILLMAFTAKGIAQNAESLNNYKYVVIPVKYEFQSEKNQWLLNSLTKFMLKKNGFTTLMENEKKPSDLELNNCLALYANVLSNGTGLFSFVTKTTLELKNCQGDVVFKSKEGTSREKKYKTAMNKALREAFTSLDSINYTYNGGNGYYDSEKGKGQLAGASKHRKGSSEFERALKSTFRLNNTSYVLKKIEAGYVLKEEETGKRVAVLNVTDSKNILFNSDSMSGTASFNSQGDMVIEYFDSVANAVKQVTYENIGQQ